MLVDQIVQANSFGQRHHRRQATERDQVRVIEYRFEGMADSHYECSCQRVELNCRKSYSSLSQEHSPSRHTHHPRRIEAQRNGYRHRELDTRVGTLDVAIPKLRSGSW